MQQSGPLCDIASCRRAGGVGGGGGVVGGGVIGVRIVFGPDAAFHEASQATIRNEFGNDRNRAVAVGPKTFATTSTVSTSKAWYTWYSTTPILSVDCAQLIWNPLELTPETNGALGGVGGWVSSPVRGNDGGCTTNSRSDSGDVLPAESRAATEKCWFAAVGLSGSVTLVPVTRTRTSCE
jgi:hypothetical protein